jgi:hypothetical protein
LTLVIDSTWLNMIGAMSAEGNCPQILKGLIRKILHIKV